MSFGRNPHVAKAEAAETKAAAARDAWAVAEAWREAARHWDRAADREADARKKQTYEARAQNAREMADKPVETEAPSNKLLN
jgi:hypothetical protein